MKQQTAIEWLVDQLKELAFIPEHHIGMGDIRVSQGYLDELAEQAKQMEKEQIVISFMEGDGSDCTQEEDPRLYAEQYYNETYRQ